MAKKELFNKELQNTALFCKALGHPARLAILKYLAETKVCITGDIAHELPLSRTTVKQHLAELKDLGLIHGEIEGAKTNYCLNMHRIDQMIEILKTYFNIISCCENESCQ